MVSLPQKRKDPGYLTEHVFQVRACSIPNISIIRIAAGTPRALNAEARDSVAF